MSPIGVRGTVAAANFDLKRAWRPGASHAAGPIGLDGCQTRCAGDARAVKALLLHHPECRFLVFDFKLVTGIDSSAAYSFAQIKRAAHDRGIQLVLVHLPPMAEKALRSSDFIRWRKTARGF